MVGALLTGVFAVAAIGGEGKSGLIDGNAHQVLTQLYGIAVTAGYCAIATLVILKVLDATLGLRVDTETERDGMDLAIHGEVVQ
jgi:ammonium transporter, Amt family